MAFRLHFESVSRYLSATILSNNKKTKLKRKKWGEYSKNWLIVDFFKFYKKCLRAPPPQAFGKIQYNTQLLVMFFS